MYEADALFVRGWNFTLLWYSLLLLFEYIFQATSEDIFPLGDFLYFFVLDFFFPEEELEGIFPPS